MTFELLNRICFAILAALALTLLVAPGIIHWLFAIDSGAGADTMSRRAALLFAGLAVMVFLAGDTTSLEVQHIVSAAVLVTMSGLAVLGLVEWLRGAVGFGIWLAIIVELFFAWFYFRYWQE